MKALAIIATILTLIVFAAAGYFFYELQKTRHELYLERDRANEQSFQARKFETRVAELSRQLEEEVAKISKQKEYHPVASNDTSAGCSKNRRIEIALLPLAESEVAAAQP